RSAGTLALSLILAAGVLLSGGWLLSVHARAWDLGGRSPVLGYDAAQYALAARELSEHGRLATTFALPIELASHSEPPWPLAAVQPGLVLGEALVDRIAPGSIPLGPGRHLSLASPSEREWLSLVIPVASFLALGLLLAMAAATLISVTAPGLAAG